jgi:hypothetical protein
MATLASAARRPAAQIPADLHRGDIVIDGKKGARAYPGRKTPFAIFYRVEKKLLWEHRGVYRVACRVCEPLSVTVSAIPDPVRIPRYGKVVG